MASSNLSRPLSSSSSSGQKPMSSWGLQPQSTNALPSSMRGGAATSGRPLPSAAPTAKKLTMIELAPPMDAATATKQVAVIQRAISQIFARNYADLYYESLYHTAYTLVVDKHGRLLYEGFMREIETNIKLQAQMVANAEGYYSSDDLLERVAQSFEWHLKAFASLGGLLLYMDKCFEQGRRPTVNELGLLYYQHFLLRHPVIQPAMLGRMLTLIEQARNLELVSLDNVRSSCLILIEVTMQSRLVYEELFEQHLLAATEIYYRARAQELLAQSTVTDYLKSAAQMLEYEQKLCESYTDRATTAKVIPIVVAELVTKHLNHLVTHPTGLSAMLHNGIKEDLRCLYQLVQRSGPASVEFVANATRDLIHAELMGILHLQRPFSSDAALSAPSSTPATPARSVSENGAEAAGTPASPPTSSPSASASNNKLTTDEAVSIATELCRVVGKHEEIASIGFDKAKPFQKALKDALERALNGDMAGPRSALILAQYTDYLLTNTRIGADELEARLTDTTSMFRYLHDKDVFELLYKSHLAKRLFNKRAADSDAERGMIARLKTECGSYYTSKLEAMFTDVRNQSTINSNFQTFVKDKAVEKASKGVHWPYGDSQPSLSILILTSGSWPQLSGGDPESSKTLVLPKELTTLQSQFQEFYAETYSGRRLSWSLYGGVPDSGHVDVKAFGYASLPSATSSYEITLTPIQACVLMLFNALEGDRALTFQEIQARTNAPAQELKRHLISMALPNYQILTKSGHKREFKDADVYNLNLDFKSKLRKFRVPLVAASNIPMEEGASQLVGNDRAPSSYASAGADRADLPNDGDHASSVPDSMDVLEDISYRTKLEEDRRHFIDAALVRILKTRRSIDQPTLVTETIRMLRFRPSIPDIKKRIESLVEREYIQREADMKTYTYIA